jgi:hypothetical protein
MKSRDLGAKQGLIRAVMTATALFSTAVLADGPGYTYLAASYEWTDVKYGVDPNGDPDFNNGGIEGVNLDLSVGILSWFHLTGQYFTGDCTGCSTFSQNNQPTNVDLDFEGYKLGIGFNVNLNKKENTDFVIRGNYIDVDLDTPKNAPFSGGVPGDGYSILGQIRSQISEKADVMVGYEYTIVDYTDPTTGSQSVKNRDLLVGIGYRVWKGLSLNGNAIVFDDDTGFDLGVRWYFGGLWDGDSIIGNDR